MTYIIDVNNVVRFGNADGCKATHVDNLINLIAALEAGNNDFRLLADANIEHLLSDAGEAELNKWRGIKEKFGDKVGVCPAGNQADAYILFLAEAHGYDVISCDTFRQWWDKFPWIKTIDSAGNWLPIEKRRVHPFMIADGLLMIGDLNLAWNIENQCMVSKQDKVNFSKEEIAEKTLEQIEAGKAAAALANADRANAEAAAKEIETQKMWEKRLSEDWRAFEKRDSFALEIAAIAAGLLRLKFGD